jgi:hypothetical protein
MCEAVPRGTLSKGFLCFLVRLTKQRKGFVRKMEKIGKSAFIRQIQEADKAKYVVRHRHHTANAGYACHSSNRGELFTFFTTNTGEIQ